MLPVETRIKEHAHSLGFELVGIAPAGDADGFAHLQDWLAQGFAGEMDYMQRHAQARGHPDSILPNVRSVVMVRINYKPSDEYSVLSTQYSVPGRIARYAGGRDYH